MVATKHTHTLLVERNGLSVNLRMVSEKNANNKQSTSFYCYLFSRGNLIQYSSFGILFYYAKKTREE